MRPCSRAHPPVPLGYVGTSAGPQASEHHEVVLAEDCGAHVHIDPANNNPPADGVKDVTLETLMKKNQHLKSLLQDLLQKRDSHPQRPTRT